MHVNQFKVIFHCQTYKIIESKVPTIMKYRLELEKAVKITASLLAPHKPVKDLVSLLSFILCKF